MTKKFQKIVFFQKKIFCCNLKQLFDPELQTYTVIQPDLFSKKIVMPVICHMTP